jgi:hypothetical protein
MHAAIESSPFEAAEALGHRGDDIREILWSALSGRSPAAGVKLIEASPERQ